MVDGKTGPDKQGTDTGHILRGDMKRERPCQTTCRAVLDHRRRLIGGDAKHGRLRQVRRRLLMHL